MFLSRPEWEARRNSHEARVDALLGDHLERRRRGLKHPVRDFLFTYYSYRPAQLRRWHAGLGVELEDVPPIEAAEIRRRADSIRWIRDLLVATAGRPGSFGCFGMHEWAMVYRQSQQELRHNAWPLRLAPERTAEVVEERGVRCGHYDAFRFFTPPARPLNLLQPTRESQIRLEQPGCLHANMDLYKWSYKLAPLAPSELIADCFELAGAIRGLDMRASPYDLADLGYEPVRVETPEGRAEYAAAQRDFAERAKPLRDKLIEVCATALRGI
ncbi:MAG TPA: hypothetical protein VF062_12310 [Candidatus Limnocylindrales bacterium]